MHTAAAPCRIASRSSLSVSLSRPARPSHHTHSRTLPPPRPPHPRSLARSHTHAHATTPRRPTHPPTQPAIIAQPASQHSATPRLRQQPDSLTHKRALSRAHSHSHTLTRLADDSLAHPTHTHLLAQPMHAARLVLAPLAAGSRGGGPRPSRPDRSASHQRPLAPRPRSPRDREHHRPSRSAIHHSHEQLDAPRSPAARRSARAFACTHTHTRSDRRLADRRATASAFAAAVTPHMDPRRLESQPRRRCALGAALSSVVGPALDRRRSARGPALPPRPPCLSRARASRLASTPTLDHTD